MKEWCEQDAPHPLELTWPDPDLIKLTAKDEPIEQFDDPEDANEPEQHLGARHQAIAPHASGRQFAPQPGPHRRLPSPRNRREPRRKSPSFHPTDARYLVGILAACLTQPTR